MDVGYVNTTAPFKKKYTALIKLYRNLLTIEMWLADLSNESVTYSKA